MSDLQICFEADAILRPQKLLITGVNIICLEATTSGRCHSNMNCYYIELYIIIADHFLILGVNSKSVSFFDFIRGYDLKTVSEDEVMKT